MVDRKQICEAFKEAKKLTASNGEECISDNYMESRSNSGKFEFICHALNHIALPGSQAASKIIYNRFGCSIYTWLYINVTEDHNLLSDDNVQAYKHRWLDSVIKEFSK